MMQSSLEPRHAVRLLLAYRAMLTHFCVQEFKIFIQLVKVLAMQGGLFLPLLMGCAWLKLSSAH